MGKVNQKHLENPIKSAKDREVSDPVKDLVWGINISIIIYNIYLRKIIYIIYTYGSNRDIGKG